MTYQIRIFDENFKLSLSFQILKAILEYENLPFEVKISPDVLKYTKGHGKMAIFFEGKMIGKTHYDLCVHINKYGFKQL